MPEKTTEKSTKEKKSSIVKDKAVSEIENLRIVIFRSNNFIYAAAFDVLARKTLFSVSSKEIKEKIKKSEAAYKVGQAFAKRLEGYKVKNIAFDRNGYKYHGRVKALATGARDSGLKF